MPLKNISSSQKVATSTTQLQDSYNRLYQEWLGEHRNLEQQSKLFDALNVGDGKLLDVACGLGLLMEIAESKGTESYGIDISSVAIRRGKAANPDFKLVEGNGEFLPWQDETFEYVTCLGSLEHFVSPANGVREISRVLKSSGRAALMLPNSHNIMAIYNVYKTGGILPELQDYERFGTRLEWQTLIEENGLKVLSVQKYNVGFSRLFKKGRESFWYIYNIIFRLFGGKWIPLNLSFALIYICEKKQIRIFPVGSMESPDEQNG